VVRSTEAVRKLERSKRHYNAWVVNETVEDYSLRYAPKSFQRWSEFTVANTALGGISYLADFAIGGSIAISSGFTNSFWAIILSAIIIFVTGTPISYYAARYNIFHGRYSLLSRRRRDFLLWGDRDVWLY
jgi:hypothetical protein